MQLVRIPTKIDHVSIAECCYNICINKNVQFSFTVTYNCGVYLRVDTGYMFRRYTASYRLRFVSTYTYLNYICSAYSDMTSDKTTTKLDASDYTNITLTVFDFIQPIARFVELKPALEFMQLLLGFEVSPHAPYIKQ